MDTICRLCASVKSTKQLACTIDDQALNIEEKLIDCCRWKQFQSAENDNLPRNICTICLKNLEKCWAFAESVAQAQQVLIAQFVHVKPTILLEIETVNTNNFHGTDRKDIKIIEDITFSPPEPFTYYEQDFVESKPDLLSNEDINEDINEDESSDYFENEPPKPLDELAIESQQIEEYEKVDVDLLNSLPKDAKNANGTISKEHIFKLNLEDWSMIKTRCSICRQTFENHHHLQTHFNAHHPHQTLRFLCMFCNSTLGKKRSVFRHIINSHRPYLKYWSV